MALSESLYQYFTGCQRLRNRFQITYEQMEELKKKIVDQKRKGNSPEEALEEIQQDIMTHAPQVQDWLLNEMLDALPPDIKDQIKDFLDQIRKELNDKLNALKKQRRKAFEDALNKLNQQQDPLKNLKQKQMASQQQSKTTSKMQEKMSQKMGSPQDVTQFLKQLEKTLKNAQTKGKKLDELFDQLKSLSLPQDQNEINDLVPTQKSRRRKRTLNLKTLKKIQEKLRKELVKALQQSGTFRLTRGKLTFGEDLIEIMADKILAEILKEIRQNEEGAPVETTGEQTGELTRIGDLHSMDEVERMLPVESLIAALQKHPDRTTIDPWVDPVKVWKYRRETIFDTIIAVDLSGSMNRNYKHQSAKETALALERAVRKINPNNRTALIVFQTTAFLATPDQVWDTRPTGYTNTPDALRLTADALKQWASKSSYILFVTDGFPELPGKSHQRVLQEAIEEAAKLKHSPTTLFRMVLIENKPRFIEAGRKIVKAANGRLIITNPDRLRDNVLTDFIRGFRGIASG